MSRLSKRYGLEKMLTVRASRVDYYTQHDVSSWRDQLGALGLRGDDSVFVNLAAVAGPQPGRYDALMDVNYRAPVAAAQACQELGFGHWVQSSTQATNAERAGQVPYARAKSMTDFALANMTQLPVSIAVLGLLYNKYDGLVGQEGSDLNLADLCRFPLTPIMGSGSAPLQPHEVSDAAERIAFLGLSEPAMRPIQPRLKIANLPQHRDYTLRVYDAVGPETLSLLQMLERLGPSHNPGGRFRPVQIDYRNMERLLNVKSLGNMNRQFVSLLRSEQDTNKPILGDPTVWTTLLGPNAKLVTLQEAFNPSLGGHHPVRKFPLRSLLMWAWKNPRVIVPGAAVLAETLVSFWSHGLLHTKRPETPTEVPP